MKRSASVVIALGLIGGVLLGNVETASSQAPPQGRTLTFFDRNATDFEKTIDEGRNGFSAGDWTMIKDRFYDTETCDVAATFLGRFTFIKSAGKRDGFFLLDGGTLLPDGKLTVYWPGRFSDFESTDAATGGAITGGTGAYEGVGGTIKVQEGVEMCERQGALITIELAQ